jgi:glycosyltransferase involved in cell wall biosynthesis
MHERYNQLLQRNKNSVFTFAMVGSINPNKGQADAIRAINKIAGSHRVRLILAGTGGSRYIRRLKALCESLEVDDLVDFLGFVEDPFDVYMRADALLVCSKYEGMGRVTAEAMSIGLPVIGRNSTGTAELIDHRKTGLIYNGDVEELVEQMIEVILNYDLRRDIGECAWAKACRQFTIERYCEQVYQVFDSALADHRR